MVYYHYVCMHYTLIHTYKHKHTEIPSKGDHQTSEHNALDPVKKKKALLSALVPLQQSLQLWENKP